jgi:hypothetical protein
MINSGTHAELEKIKSPTSETDSKGTGWVRLGNTNRSAQAQSQPVSKVREKYQKTSSNKH